MIGGALPIDEPGVGELSERSEHQTHWAGFAHTPGSGARP